MTLKTTTWDITDHLDTREERDLMLAEAVDDDYEPISFVRLVSEVLRAKVRHEGENAPIESADLIAAYLDGDPSPSQSKARDAVRKANLAMAEQAA